MTPRSFRILLTALLGLLLAGVFGATPAAAHAAVTGTSPKQGTVVRNAPRQVVLTFTEGVQLTHDSLRVLDPKGAEVARGQAAHQGGKGDTAGIALAGGLRDGTYTVVWKAVSADSHPVAGAFTFSIGAPSKTTVSVSSDDGGVARVLYDSGRYLAYGGFILMAGGCVFAGLCGWRTSQVRRLAAAGWAVLFAATVALILLRGPYTGTGVGLGTLTTRPGAALLARLLLLAPAAWVLAAVFGGYGPGQDPFARRETAYRLGIGGSAVAVALAATWALAGHAAVGIQPWLAMPVTAVHLLAAAMWLGGLAALAVALRGRPPVAGAVVRRFSRLAFRCVVVLAATGVYQAWRGIDSWGELVTTGYGQLLLVKVGLVALVVAVASVSRRWTARLADPARAVRVRERSAVLASGSAGGVRAGGGHAGVRRPRSADVPRGRLRRSVLAETAVALVVLAVTTVLTDTETGRTHGAQAAASSARSTQVRGSVSLKLPFDTGGRNGRGTAGVLVEPALAGDNTLHVFLSDPGRRPMDVPEVRVRFTLPARNLGPLPASLHRIDEGDWAAGGVQLTVPGRWRIAVTVRTSAIDEVTVTKSLTIT